MGVDVKLAGRLLAAWLRQSDLPGFESWETLAKSPDHPEPPPACHGTQHPPVVSNQGGMSRAINGPRVCTWDPSERVFGHRPWR